MDIKEENIISAYKTADDNGKKLLQALFPNTQLEANKTSEKRPITERIKTFDDAYRELGSEHPFCKTLDLFIQTNVNNDISNIADVLAYLKLRIICAALNEGWEPKFTKDEYRYYPYFYVLTKEEYEHLKDDAKGRCVVFAYPSIGSAGSSTVNGVRLALRTKELAQYAGKQFLDIWIDFVFKIVDTDKIEAE